MIQMETQVKITDNSRARYARCIKTYKKKKIAEIGDTILVSITKHRTKKAKVKKGEMAKGIVIRTKTPLRRKDGSFLSFSQNSVLLMKAPKKPYARRLRGPVPIEIVGSCRKTDRDKDYKV